MTDEEKWAAFQLRMKNATRSVHDLQDKTITGLFAATLYFGGSQDLWYQALARFELVFNELEDCLDCQKKLSAWDIPGMRVSQYIKEDLDAYYGKERKFSSAAVNTWIAEIRKIRFDQPLLVTAYIYHMYLGLYSGGRILRHKFKLKGKTLELDPKLNIKEGLKDELRRLLCEQPELEDGLIEHSQKLFKLNNRIIHECENPNIEILKYLGLIGFCALSFYAFAKLT